MVPKCSLFERNETSFKVKNQNLQNIQIWVKTAAAILWRILEEFSLYWWKLESLEIKLISLKLITDHGFQNAQNKRSKIPNTQNKRSKIPNTQNKRSH